MSLKSLNSIGGFSVGNNQPVVYANGDIITGNANLGNAATANFFLGDGGLLSNLPSGNNLANGNSNVSVIANSNITMSVAGNSNVVVVTGTGINVAGTGNFTGNLVAGNFLGVFANGNSNVRIPSANGNVNISAAGNANIFVVRGNGIVANGSVVITDPVVEQGGFANGAPLTSDDGKDRGIALNYYDSFSTTAFMGWQNANSEFILASEVTVTNDVVTVYALGNVRASYFLGNVLGNIQGNIVSPGSNTQVLFNDNNQINASSGFTFNKSTNALTVTGRFEANSINTLGYANAGNFYTPGNLQVLGTANVGELYSLGNVNAISTVSGFDFQAGGNIQATGNISGGNLSTSGQANITGNVNAGNANLAGNLTVVGNANVSGNSRFSNAVIFNNRITVGDPNSFPKVDAFPNGYLQTYNLDVTAYGGNGNINGNLSARYVGASYANIGTLNISQGVLVAGNIVANAINANLSINALGNLSVANANLGNLATANFFQGDGWLLTNLTIPAGSAIENGNSNVRVEPNANIVFSVTGTNAVVTVTTNSIEANGSLNATSNVTANNITANIAVYTQTVREGNSRIDLDGTSNFIKLGVNAASNRFYVDANGAAITGNLSVSNRANITGNLNVSGNTSVQALETKNITANGTVNANGNITSLNANLGNLVTANFFSGDGYLLTNLTIAAGSAIVNGNSNVTVAPNANVSVSVGGVDNVTTFTNTSVVVNKLLDVNANANIANWVNANALYVTGTANFASGLTATSNSTITSRYVNIGTGALPGYLDVSGNVNFDNRLTVGGTANFSGIIQVNQTIYSNANIQADDYLVANYFSINKTGNVPNLNVSNVANITTLNVSGDFDANGNATIDGNLTTGNANLGNLAKANFFQGDGYLLTNLTITAGSSILNGNSNVVVIANGNVTTSVGGTANVLVVTTTGANIAGTLNATGNATVGNLTAGIGNFSGALTANGNITANGSANINGNLIANGYANITGNLIAANANLGNYAYANFFEGDGSLLTNLTITAGNALLNGNSNVYVEYSGNINFRANGVANIFVVSNTGAYSNGNLTVANTVNAESYSNGTSNIIIRTNSDVTISAGGTANVVQVTNLGANVTGTLRSIGNLSVSGNANVGNLGVGGLISAAGNVSGGNLSTGGNLSVAGVANIQTISSPGEISATGNITSSARLSGLTLNVNGTSNLANVNVSGISNLGPNGNVIITGGSAGQSLITDGAGNLSWGNAASAGALANGNSNVNIPVANGNVTVSVAGNSNVFVVTGTGITTSGNLNVSGNAVVSGNLTVDGNLTYINVTDLAVEDPIIQLQVGPNNTPLTSNTGKDVGTALNYYDTSAKIAFMGWDVSNAEIAFGSNVSISSEVVTFTQLANIRSGNAQLGNLATANFISGALTTAAQPNITSVGTLSSLTVSGNANVGNLNAGNITTTGSAGNISGANVITACTFIGNTGNFSTALNVTGTSNLGPVGNVTITGGSSGQYLQTNGSGVLSWATISTGSVSNGNSNVNIPVANGNVNISAAGNANILVVTGTGVNVAGTLNATGNANVGNIGATNGVFTNVSGNGANLSSITGSNVTGQVGNALVAGTVYTAAQPNITSVGTLTSLTVSGNATVGNLIGPHANGNSNINIPAANGNVNISVAGNSNVLIVTGTGVNVTGTLNSTGNITGANASLGNLVTANFFTGVLTTAAQPNITSVGTLSSLTTTGNVSVGGNLSVTAKSNLGSVSNVIITGGTANYVLSTDGAGNLSWVVQSGGSGTPGGSNTQVQFNDSNTFAGNAGFTFNKTTTTLTANNFVATSTANLGAVGNITITGGTNGQVLVTNGSGGLNWGNVGTAVTVDDFTGNGSQTAYTLSTIPASVDYTLVSIAGTFQPRNAYSLAGNVLTFTSAPPNTALIEVTTLAAATYAGPNTGTFINRTYTGNGAQNTFTVTNGVTANSVIVTENGIVQEPGSDYTVSGATLTFTTAPANAVAISVREIPATGGGATWASSSANLTASANTKYVLDTSGSNITVTLPGSPSFGMEVGVIDGTGNANTNQITVYGNGSNIQGSSSNMTVTTSRAAFTLVYYNSAQGWILTNV